MVGIKIVLNYATDYTQEGVGLFKTMFLIFEISSKPMPHMGYNEKSVKDLSFISETSGISNLNWRLVFVLAAINERSYLIQAQF